MLRGTTEADWHRQLISRLLTIRPRGFSNAALERSHSRWRILRVFIKMLWLARREALKRLGIVNSVHHASFATALQCIF